MYFRAWPFGLTPERDAAVWADRKELYNKLNDLFQNFADRKRSFVQHIWGYLGAGKTHAVWHFSLILEKQKQLRFMYSRFPTHVRNFLELYRDGFMPSFDFEILADRCSNLWKVLSFGKNEEEAFFQIRNQIAGKYDDLAQVFFNIAKIWGASPMKALRDTQFVTSRMWLEGAKLGKRDMNAIGVTGSIGNDADAINALGGIVRLFAAQEISGKDQIGRPVVWIMDDSHVLFARQTKEQELIQRGVRRVIDECPENLLILMSFATPDPEKVNEGLIDELKTVSGHSVLEIPPLSKEDALVFITDLINHEGFKKDGAADKFYPYTKESLSKAIEEIVNRGIDLLPRNLIKCFDHVTDEAQKAGIQTIDAKFMNLFFKDKCVSKFCPLLSLTNSP